MSTVGLIVLESHTSVNAWYRANCGGYPHVHVDIVYWTASEILTISSCLFGTSESVLILITMYRYFTNLDIQFGELLLCVIIIFLDHY